MLRTDYCIRVSVNAFYIVSLHLLLAFIMCIFHTMQHCLSLHSAYAIICTYAPFSLCLKYTAVSEKHLYQSIGPCVGASFIVLPSLCKNPFSTNILH